MMLYIYICKVNKVKLYIYMYIVRINMYIVRIKSASLIKEKPFESLK